MEQQSRSVCGHKQGHIVMLNVSVTERIVFFRANNTEDAAKMVRIAAQREHLEKATRAREYYREKQSQGKEGLIQHLSFDYAQQVYQNALIDFFS